MKFSEIGKRIIAIQGKSRVLVVSDRNVALLYLAHCMESLEEAGISASSFVLPAGESAKTAEHYLAILNEAAALPLTRSDGIVALGGGMVGDIAGFAAATFLRGIHFYQIPTTLLSAVDASVGGKTAINLPAGKNLVGAFHLPSLVLQDPALLRSLPDDEFQNGMAEVIKYGILADKELFASLETFRRSDEEIACIIARCVALKTSYTQEDLCDQGVRQLLNFGHTVGHALETLSDHTIRHGSAVAMGMRCMTEIAVARGWCASEDGQRIGQLLDRFGFARTLPYSTDAIAAAIRCDKKRRGDRIRLVIPKEIGRCALHEIALQELPQLLAER